MRLRAPVGARNDLLKARERGRKPLRYPPCLAILCPVWAHYLKCCPGLNTEPDPTDYCPS